VNRSSSHAIAGSLRDLLVGEDPRDVERLWQKMYRGLIYIGRRGIALHALSGIDIALWDVKGRARASPSTSSSAARSTRGSVRTRRG
jgi:L-alanine-DL-glutamate epimerase-like enolase superfamily enzyme